MTDVTQQLADALRELLAGCINEYGQPDEGAASESVGWNGDGSEMAFTYGLMQRAAKVLTAFEASRAAPECKPCFGSGQLADPEIDGEDGYYECPFCKGTGRAALSALPARDEGLEALRELLDEHDKAHGETKYTPAKQPPYSMTMDGLHRQAFAAMYAYVRNKLAQEPRK